MVLLCMKFGVITVAALPIPSIVIIWEFLIFFKSMLKQLTGCAWSPLVYLRHYMIQFYNMDKISMGPSLLHPQEESLSGPSIYPPSLLIISGWSHAHSLPRQGNRTVGAKGFS